jgi:hypothetical protein
VVEEESDEPSEEVVDSVFGAFALLALPPLDDEPEV